MSFVITAGSQQAKQLQDDIQNELVRRGTADAEDSTMAEYVTVMLINQKTSDQINEELSDLQGLDFDPTFTPWLFARAEAIALGTAAVQPEPEVQPAAEDASMEAMDTSTSGLSRPGRPAGNAGPRLLSHALAPLGNQPIRTHMTQGVKRGFSPEQSRAEENKRRSLGGNRHAPSGPRAMRDEEIMDDSDARDSRQNGAGKSLIERLGGPPLNHHAPEFHMGAGSHRGRGMGRPRGGHHGQNGHPYQRPMQRGMQNNGFFPPAFPGGPEAFAMQTLMMQQQEQMMQMQLMMQQMAQVIQPNGQLGQPPATHGRRHISAQPQQKIGGHTISARPAGTVVGNRSLINETMPEKPTSVEICKFGVGCTNKRCPYSHPSPVATQASGMVLRADACPNGKECKDPDCPSSHVSPAQVNEEGGPSKILCKFPNCTNPNCQFRHEDANGNPIPPPALTRKQAESSAMETDEPVEQDDVNVTMDHVTGSTGMAHGKSALDSPLAAGGSAKPLPGKPLNGTVPVSCKFGAGCTNPKCKFIHDNRKPCNFGVKCFKADCPYSHPPGRKLGGAAINTEGFTPYKPKEGQLVDRSFGGETEAVEKVLPGSGLNVKAEPVDDIKVEMG